MSFSVKLLVEPIKTTRILSPPQAIASITIIKSFSVPWKLVFQEDVPVVEGMQRGRHAVNFDGGRFSPAMDNPTHCFHYWVANEVQNGRIRKS